MNIIEQGGPELAWGPVTQNCECPICKAPATIAITTGFAMVDCPRDKSYRFECGTCGEFQINAQSLDELKKMQPIKDFDQHWIRQAARQRHLEGMTLTQEDWRKAA